MVPLPIEEEADRSGFRRVRRESFRFGATSTKGAAHASHAVRTVQSQASASLASGAGGLNAKNSPRTTASGVHASQQVKNRLSA